MSHEKYQLYHEETLKLVDYHEAILSDAASRLNAQTPFSPMEEQGILHSLQVVTENCIGKAKHLLKLAGQRVPVNGYDAFCALHQTGQVSQQDLNTWRKAIGLRNAIVHEYMQVDMEIVNEVVREKYFVFLLDFLRKSIPAIQ